MRAVPESMAASLAGGVTTFAHVWRVTRRDGAVFGFTDHDRSLLLDALACEPVVGLSAGAIEKSVGLEVDTSGIGGALSSDAIAEGDLARGLWDGARVDLYRVDWRDPVQRIHLYAGRIGEVRRGARAFEAELRGLQAPLNVPVGRVFSRHCDADFGDARCGVDAEAGAYRGEGVVADIVSSTVFHASELDAFVSAWFARGRLVWAEGGQSEVVVHRQDGALALIELLDAPGAALSIGAAFVVHAGCDKRFDTCRGKFANNVNFRGFPHMPGNDALISGPIASERMDGSSRRT